MQPLAAAFGGNESLTSAIDLDALTAYGATRFRRSGGVAAGVNVDLSFVQNRRSTLEALQMTVRNAFIHAALMKERSTAAGCDDTRAELHGFGANSAQGRNN